MHITKLSSVLGWLIPASLCLTLAGCASEPNEEEMADAVKQRVVAMAGPMGAAIDLVEFKKLGCKPADQGYLCEFKASMQTPMGLHDGTDTGLFIKDDKGWRVIEQ